MERIIETYKNNLPKDCQERFLRLETMKRQYVEGNTTEVCGDSLNGILEKLNDFYLLAIDTMKGKSFQDSLRN